MICKFIHIIKRFYIENNLKMYFFRLFIMLTLAVIAYFCNSKSMALGSSISLMLFFICTYESIFYSFRISKEFSLSKLEFLKKATYITFEFLKLYLILLCVVEEAIISRYTFSNFWVTLITIIVLFVLILLASLKNAYITENYFLKLSNAIFSYIDAVLVSLIIIGVYYIDKIENINSMDSFIVFCNLIANGLIVVTGQLLKTDPISAIFTLLFWMGSVILTLVSNRVISDVNDKKYYITIKYEK